jgi:ubiquinol-cytochrome c reductase cytochrome b subunit
VLALVAAIVVMFFLPWLDTSRVRSAVFRPIYRQFFWIFVLVCLGLGYLGSQPAEGGYVIASRILTAYYFLHFLVIMPVLGLIERPKPRPASITEAVLAKAGHAPARAAGGAS